MKYLLTYSFILAGWFGNAQILLPGYKTGNWWIIRADKSIKLSKRVIRLQNFDTNGFAIFEDERAMGVLDSNGTVLCQSESETIESWGDGLFVFSDTETKRIVDLKSMDTLLKEVTNFKRLNTCYMQFNRGPDTSLLHIPTRNSWYFASFLHQTTQYYNAVLIQKDSLTKILYTPNGEEVCIDTSAFVSGWLLTYVLGGKQYTLTRSRLIETPFRTNNIAVEGSYLSYNDGKWAYLLNLEEDKIEAKVPYDQIRKCEPRGYLVMKNGKTGYLNNAFQLKIPVKYESIWTEKGRFLVTMNGLTGVMDEQYNLRIPCEFQFIWEDSSFVYTRNNSNFYGLYTKKLYPLLQTMYNRIVLRDRLIKAYTRDKLRILQLDTDDRILTDIVLKNALTAKQSAVQDNFTFDKRLLPLGWYYERRTVTDSSGIALRYQYIWGLKREDSIIAQPRFSNPVFVPNEPFSMVNGMGSKFKLAGLNYKIGRTFNLVQHANGKRMDSRSYLFFNTKDGSNRNFYRCATTEGYGFYHKDAEFEKVDYIGQTAHRLVPYAKDATIKIEKTTDNESFSFWDWTPVHAVRNGWSEQEKFYFLNERSIKLENAVWNYKDTNGLDRFSEPFTFAEGFVRETAITKRKTGWGVVNQDTTIIDFVYSEIKRVPLMENYGFLVKKNASHQRFLDSNLVELPLDFHQVLKFEDDLAVMESKGEKAVFFQGYEVERDLKNARLLNNGFWFLRDRKEYQVLDSAGNLIYTSLHKPIHVFSAEYLLVQNKGKQAVVRASGETVRASGETVVEFDKMEVQEFAHFYFVKSKLGNKLYDRDFKFLVKENPKEKIIPNRYTATYARIRKQTIKSYSDQNELLKKIKNKTNQAVNAYHYNYFVGENYLLEDTFHLVLNPMHKVEFHADGMLQVQLNDYQHSFYRETICKPIFTVNAAKVSYLGESTISYLESDQRIVQNLENRIQLHRNADPIGSFADQMVLFKTGGKYRYINHELKTVVNRNFQDATPFKNGRACVKQNGGWSLLTKEGKLVSFPSYAKVSPVSTNFFQTKELPKYGLFDSSGREIIPPIYEQIVFITPAIIQVVRKGQMGYFDVKGEEIFPIP